MNIFRKFSFLFLFIINLTHLSCQFNYKITTLNGKKEYVNEEKYIVKEYDFSAVVDKKPKNIILFIGDGMGVSQVYAGLTANGNSLFLENLRYIGFSKTQSSNKYITDSAAGGTAISTGKKTYNGAIGVDSDTNRVETILEIAEKNNYATGLVASSSITHATPASFIAHQPSRKMDEAIAADFLKTDIEVVIGGGLNYFTKREDGRNLLSEFQQKGYKYYNYIDSVKTESADKIICLTADKHAAMASQRHNLLEKSVDISVEILKKNENGFFLMVEGSQIDWGAHQNNTEYVVREMLDLDKAIGRALEFAYNDGNTLVILTADHETGGMALTDGDMAKGKVEGQFVYHSHTGVMVPVFAAGPSALNYIGIYENTDLFHKMMLSFGFVPNKN